MAMVPSTLGTAIKNAIRAVAITPINTYQERLMIALATEIVKHLKNNADIKNVQVNVTGVPSTVSNASVTLYPQPAPGSASQASDVNAQQNNLGKIE